MTDQPSIEQQLAHLNEGTCNCHDSWDQCPCAESGHFPDCNCCPLGTGLCGPKRDPRIDYGPQFGEEE